MPSIDHDAAQAAPSLDSVSGGGAVLRRSAMAIEVAKVILEHVQDASGLEERIPAGATSGSGSRFASSGSGFVPGCGGR